MRITTNPIGPLNYKIAYRSKGRFCTAAKADTVYIKLPRGRKWHRFEIIRPKGVRKSAKYNNAFATELISEIEYQKLKRKEKARGKVPPPPTGPAEVPVTGEIPYIFKQDKSFKVLKKSRLGPSNIYNFTYIFKQKVEISKDNVDDVIAYLAPFVADKLKQHVLEIKPFGRKWRVYLRLMGAGKFVKYEKADDFFNLPPDEQAKYKMDDFGFSTERKMLQSIAGIEGLLNTTFERLKREFSKGGRYFAEVVLETAKDGFFITGVHYQFVEILDVPISTPQRKRLRSQR